MVAIAPEYDLLSIGKLAELLQATPNRIERAVEAAGVRPAWRLNGIVYVRDVDVDAIRLHLPSRCDTQAASTSHTRG